VVDRAIGRFAGINLKLFEQAAKAKGQTTAQYRDAEVARRATPVYLNLRKASIYGGSNEIQRQIITKSILGL